MSKKVWIAIIAVVLAVIVGATLFFTLGGKDNSTEPNVGEQQTEQQSEQSPSAEPDEGAQAPSEGEFTPTFIYFVSSEDDNYDDVLKTVDSLKAKYADKVTFDIRDIAKDPSALTGFEFVEGNTPTLIMLNKDNNISNLLMQVTDQATMEKTIEQAMA